ncbi:MAG: hypothetical protein KA270_02890 [Saprospiraceae bacterium]|nr:hypothetical protein [Saprospiraceae bacterium]
MVALEINNGHHICHLLKSYTVKDMDAYLHGLKVLPENESIDDYRDMHFSDTIKKHSKHDEDRKKRDQKNTGCFSHKHLYYYFWIYRDGRELREFEHVK